MSWNTEDVDREFYERIKNKEEIFDEVRQRLLQKCDDFFLHPELKIMVENSPKESFLSIGSKKSSLPQNKNPLGKTTRVTLLGDAMHPMTTHAGLGANTALQDAYHLYQALIKEDWYNGLVEYEKNLQTRGKKAVSFSLSNTRMIHARGWKAKIGLWAMWGVGRIVKFKRFIIVLIVLFVIFFCLRGTKYSIPNVIKYFKL